MEGSTFNRYYMMIGRKASGEKDGPWFFDDLNEFDRTLSPWLRARGSVEVFVSEVLMPPEAYTKLGASAEMPSPEAAHA